MSDHQFWMSDKHGLIRQPLDSWRPQVWREGRWVIGGPYVLDAITGMGEDVWSCGEWADKIDLAAARTYASEHDIDLDALGPE